MERNTDAVHRKYDKIDIEVPLTPYRLVDCLSMKSWLRKGRSLRLPRNWESSCQLQKSL